MEMRSVLGLVLLAPIVHAAGGLAAMRTRRPGTHLARNVVHYAAQYGWFFALTLIPIAQVVAIEFTMPVWTAILATAFLGERVGGLRALAVVLGLVGVAVIVRPSVDHVDPGQLIALVAAMGFSIAFVSRQVAHRDRAAGRDHLLDARHPVGDRPRAGSPRVARAVGVGLAVDRGRRGLPAPTRTTAWRRHCATRRRR